MTRSFYDCKTADREAAKQETGSFPVLQLIEIEVAQRLAGIGRFFGFLNRLLELFLQEIGGVLLIFDGLPENGIAAAVLLFHGPGGFFNIVESLNSWRWGVRNHGLVGVVDLQDRIAARAGNLET